MTTLDHSTIQTSVLISDLSPLMSSGISSALSNCDEFFVHLQDSKDRFPTHREALAGVDVIVTDYLHGIKFAGTRTGHGSGGPMKTARIFVLASESVEHDIRLALEAGIHGYATSGLGLAEFQDGIRAVANGERYLCHRAANHLAESMSRESLTVREGAVLRELARGSCNKTIASKLHVSVGTVKAHLRALMSKLDAKSRTQVVTVAISRGLASASPPLEVQSGLRERLPSAPASLLSMSRNSQGAQWGAS